LMFRCWTNATSSQTWGTFSCVASGTLWDSRPIAA
jgi:hypothetical protein